MNKNLLRFSYFSAIMLSTVFVSAQKRDIHITDFTISQKQEKVVLDWKTDAATQTNYFAVQKSNDGINYKTIALVLGSDPKQSCDCYGASVKRSGKSKYFYRLVHISTDGSEQYSEAKTSNP